MVEVIWSKTATEQLKRSVQFIQQERGLYYAELVLSKILSAVNYLEEFPKIGTKEPLLKSRKIEYRFIIVWSYKIIYSKNKDKIIISRVFHTSQKPTKMFSK